MRVPFYDIKAQYDELAPQLDAAVHQVLSSGGYVMGANHKAIEQELAALHQMKHGIALNSGTDALRISMDAVGMGAGDEVITTAFTFVASVETIVQTGATPVMVDIEPRGFMIDPAKIEAAITARTRAIMPIHLFGQMADVDAIDAIAKKHGLAVLEDAAQALGCTSRGRYAGHFGFAAGFSFYVTKNLGAAGDAGMIVTNDDAVAESCRSIRVHGMGRERYYYDHLGYTARMDEIQAAVLRVKLTRLAAWNARRLEIAEQYIEILKGSDVILPATLDGNNNTWHQFSILHRRRDDLQTFLRDQQVDSMIYYPVPIHHHAPYKKFAPSWSLAETERISKEILNLPIHQHLSDKAVRHVAESVLRFAEQSATVR